MRWLSPSSLKSHLKVELNFFRIHLLFFTFVPLVFSAIFWASNGEFPVQYIDALFMCYSAMTVTGLSTVNLSSLTGWQQAILFVLMLLGDVVSCRVDSLQNVFSDAPEYVDCCFTCYGDY